MTEKKVGARQINIYKKEGKYCLPFETRTTLHEDAIEDEELKLSVSTLFLDRLVAKADNRFDTEMLIKIVSLIHRTLEAVFELQGMDAARLFLDEDREPDATLDNRAIVVVAEKVLAESGLRTNLHADILSLIKDVLREGCFMPLPNWSEVTAGDSLVHIFCCSPFEILQRLSSISTQ